MRERNPGLPNPALKSQESATSASFHLILMDFKLPLSRDNRTHLNLELALALHLQLKMNFISLSHTAACSWKQGDHSKESTGKCGWFFTDPCSGIARQDAGLVQYWNCRREDSTSLAGHIMKLPIILYCDGVAGNGKAIVLIISFHFNSTAFLLTKAIENSLPYLENSCTLSKPSLTLWFYYTPEPIWATGQQEYKCQPMGNFKLSRFLIV